VEDLELSARACESLVKELGERIVAVALFGSRARGEASERSDFLVVVRGFNDKDGRFKIYHCLHGVLKRDVTVIDLDEDKLFREGLRLDSFLLNVIWDSVILYDLTGRLRGAVR